MHGYACPPPWAFRRMTMRGGRGRGGDWTMPGWGPGAGFGMWGGKGPFWAGRKAGRGDVRAAILELLAEEPMHGYQIMQELSERSGGMWRPSPGSIYPTLQQLADEELVRGEDSEGKIVYHLTDAGRAQVEDQDAPPPWARFVRPVDEGLFALKDLALQLGAAVMQVAAAGNDEQLAEAKEILAETRSRLYRLLAEDEIGGDS
jgi:DNA-binding PadR family transcriptional regulator